MTKKLTTQEEPNPDYKSQDIVPDVSPLLLRQRTLKDQVSQINQKLNDLRQQRAQVDSVIRAGELQAAGIAGALNEIEYQMNTVE